MKKLYLKQTQKSPREAGFDDGAEIPSARSERCAAHQVGGVARVAHPQDDPQRCWGPSRASRACGFALTSSSQQAWQLRVQRRQRPEPFASMQRLQRPRLVRRLQERLLP
jgi:hypothetical protein